MEVWKVAMELVVDTYQETKQLPKTELYGLTSQIRRSAISIPSNIAEGSSRKGTKEFIQFLWIANGSLSEYETQIEAAYRIGYLNSFEKLLEKVKHVRKMLLGLIRSLETKNNIDL
jgi:four helix bundle protein